MSSSFLNADALCQSLEAYAATDPSGVCLATVFVLLIGLSNTHTDNKPDAQDMQCIKTVLDPHIFNTIKSNGILSTSEAVTYIKSAFDCANKTLRTFPCFRPILYDIST